MVGGDAGRRIGGGALHGGRDGASASAQRSRLWVGGRRHCGGHVREGILQPCSCDPAPAGRSCCVLLFNNRACCTVSTLGNRPACSLARLTQSSTPPPPLQVEPKECTGTLPSPDPPGCLASCGAGQMLAMSESGASCKLCPAGTFSVGGGDVWTSFAGAAPHDTFSIFSHAMY